MESSPAALLRVADYHYYSTLRSPVTVRTQVVSYKFSSFLARN
jgi:hypothetical protein